MGKTIDQLNIQEIKNELIKRKLDTTGNKNTLVIRLKNDIAEKGQDWENMIFEYASKKDKDVRDEDKGQEVEKEVTAEDKGQNTQEQNQDEEDTSSDGTVVTIGETSDNTSQDIGNASTSNIGAGDEAGSSGDQQTTERSETKEVCTYDIMNMLGKMMNKMEQNKSDIKKDMVDMNEDMNKNFKQTELKMEQNVIENRKDMIKMKEELKEEMKKNLEAVKKEIEEELKVKYEQNKEEIESVKAKVTVIEIDMEEIKNGVEQGKEQLEKLGDTVNKCVDELEYKCEENKFKINELNKKTDKMENRIDLVEDEVKRNNRTEEKQNENLKDMERKIEQMKKTTEHERKRMEEDMIRKFDIEFHQRLQNMTTQYTTITNTGGEPIKFSGNVNEIHPVTFVEILEHRLRYVNDLLDLRIRLRTFLAGSALTWFTSVAETITNFDNFKIQFIDYFWSENVQTTIRDKLMNGRFDYKRGTRLNDYAMHLFSIAKFLEPRMREEDIVISIARHFKPEVAETVACQNMRTLNQFTSYLMRMERGLRRRTDNDSNTNNNTNTNTNRYNNNNFNRQQYRNTNSFNNNNRQYNTQNQNYRTQNQSYNTQNQNYNYNNNNTNRPRNYENNYYNRQRNTDFERRNFYNRDQNTTTNRQNNYTYNNRNDTHETNNRRVNVNRTIQRNGDTRHDDASLRTQGDSGNNPEQVGFQTVETVPGNNNQNF